MSKTYTPELPPDVLKRLEAYVAQFRPDFHRNRQAAWAHVYLHGLLTDGERKSIEPLSRRVALPVGLDIADPEQALQNFVNQAAWDEQDVGKRYRATMAQTFASPEGIFVIDDTSFPKQGKHSVGVQRQYCGALGKRANCQVAPSVHYVSPEGHFPLTMRLYLPEGWLGDQTRLDRSGVPEDERRLLSKGQIALESLDGVRAEGLAGRIVVADAGYGVSGDFRDGLQQRGLQYLVGVTDEMVVFATPPNWDEPRVGTGGRPRTRHRLAEDSPRPVSLKELASTTPMRKVTWREGTRGKLSGWFAWLRVWPASGWATGGCVGAEPVWLLIEEQAEGKIKYAISNLPPRTSRIKAVRLWKSRWPVEQGYQQMKEELGLDHFEGRSWRGFHHHACLVMLAYGFLVLEQRRARRERSRPGKRGAPRARNRAAVDPPRFTAPAGSDLSARLPVLSRPC